MKKIKYSWMILLTAMITISMTSCLDAEKGEDWDTYEMRNMLNSGWTIDKVKENGQYVDGDFWFEMNLRGNGRIFEAKRFYYKNGYKDDQTEVKHLGTFVINEKENTVVASDANGNKLMMMKIHGKVQSFIDATITFYDINKTYDMILNRSTFIKM